MAIGDLVGNLINQDFAQWSDYQIIIDNELNVSYIYAEEAIEQNKFDMDLMLCHYVEIFEEDGVTMIGVNLEQCDKLADKYAPLVEFGAINSSRWHDEWNSFPQ